MRTQEIRYEADGRQMIGTLSVGDESHERPAVLVCHEGPGRDDTARAYARRLAELGDVAFALDHCGGGKPPTHRDQMMARASWS